MKQEKNSFFRSLFSGQGKVSSPEGFSSVTVTSYSQPHVLRQKMQEEKLTHGETITAHISPVRLEKAFTGKVIMYFCPMKSIEVLQTVAPGDGGSLPFEAKLEGLTFPHDCQPGFYKLKNVVLTSNGTMQVSATKETTWEKVEA